jgi:hypothetical protein
MNEENKKPLILELDDAKKEFVRFINDLQGRGLPCYLIEMVMSDALTQLHNVAKTELEMARKQIQASE